MQEYLRYEKHERSDFENARNGYKSKNIRSHYGEFNDKVPKDRYSSFNPRIVSKRETKIFLK